MRAAFVAARIERWPTGVAGTLSPLLLSGCDYAQSALRPGGEAAEHLVLTWWILFAGAALVFVLTGGLFAVATLRRRGPDPPDPRAASESRNDARPIRWIAVGVVGTASVLILLFGYTLSLTAALDPRREAPHLVIDVEGRMWWWDVAYLAGSDTVARTANEIHVPLGARVELRLRSSDVIHSFWVPGLAGKMDMVPGRTNVAWFRADRAGTFRGQCAEFCGRQHAHMAFLVVATPAAEFEEWLARQRSPAAPPPDGSRASLGGAVFRSECAECHAVRGTSYLERKGPDLTHVATRRTLAAGTLPNTRPAVEHWVRDPQAVKPGALMPANELGPEELGDLLAYLETLR